MMKTNALKLIRNPYVQIISTYFAAHFFMLILSGCWWDDWTFMSHDLNYINIVASESGRPEWNLLVPLCWSLPNNGRILIFFLYLFISCFVYMTLKNSILFSEKESLAIAWLFSCYPVNEARILISNFAYTVGLFFFYLSFMLFMYWNKMKDSVKKKIFRGILLCLFFVSFILNSVLAYYYILIAYLFVIDIKKNNEADIIKKIIISVKNVLFYYPDFFVLPFIYYGFNKIFFPTYGDTFGSYNSVSLTGLLKCFKYIPLSLIKVFSDVAVRAIQHINIISILIVLFAIAFSVLFFSNERTDSTIKETFLKVVYGLFILAMALFPYVMVRGRMIDTIGVKGRDCVLVPFGAAIVIYSLVSLCKGKMRNALFAALLSLGIVSFNSLYIEWQKDYYYQLSMQRLLNNSIIKNNDTFFIANLNETDVQGERYYSINALSVNVYGDETRFFVPKVSEFYVLKNEDNMRHAIEALGYSHLMKDYKPDVYCFDAILNYKNEMNWLDVLKVKTYEMTDHDIFDQYINEHGSMEIVEVDDDFTKLLLDGYDNGSVKHDEDVLELLLKYSN